MSKLINITISSLLLSTATVGETFGMQPSMIPAKNQLDTLGEKTDSVSAINTITDEQQSLPNSGLLSMFTTNSKRELLYCFNKDIKNALIGISKVNNLWRLIDVENLIRKINERKKILQDNKSKHLIDYSFTGIQIPLKGYLYKKISCNDYYKHATSNIEIEWSKSIFKCPKKKEVKILDKNENKDLKTSFTERMTTLFKKSPNSLWNVFENEKMNCSWRISVGHAEKFPELSFISDTTLLRENGNHTLSEEKLSRLMFAIKLDLNTNPYLRREGVPLNTRLLFDYFLKPNEKNSHQNDDTNKFVTRKIDRYQKYLKEGENNLLTLQLLSILYPKWLLPYKKSNGILKLLDEYMIVITERMFENIDYKYIIHHIKAKNICLTKMFQNFLYEQLIWKNIYSEAIDNFTNRVINEKNKIMIYKTCLEKLNNYLKEPVRVKFRSWCEKLSNENDGEDLKLKLFKNFTYTMCKGNTGLLDIMMSFFNPYNMRIFHRIMFIPHLDKN